MARANVPRFFLVQFLRLWSLQYWSLPAPEPRSHHLLLGHGRTRRLCCPRIMRWDCSGPQINLSSEHLGLRTPCPAVDPINKHRGFQSAI
ncbi:hypothetical protein MRX96_028045 [Rhipicephalus microplus]